jgi:inosose dehydratase
VRLSLGFAPITWNNEDLREELGPSVAYATVLDEISASGYAATELGDGFPRDPATLRSAIASRGLKLPSAWCGLGFFAASAAADLAHTRAIAGLLSAVGATFINLADQSTPERMAVAGRAEAADAPRLSPGQWDDFAERAVMAAAVAREAGLQPLFHLHAGTWVETRAELEELLRRVPAEILKLVWDVGHALYGGVDPIDVVSAHPERIAYIHLKDVDGSVLETLRRERLGFGDGIRRRVFTELGRGLLDVPALLTALRDINYSGWLMVEQDSTWLPAAESARVSRDYLRGLGL